MPVLAARLVIYLNEILAMCVCVCVCVCVWEGWRGRIKFLQFCLKRLIRRLCKNDSVAYFYWNFQEDEEVNWDLYQEPTQGQPCVKYNEHPIFIKHVNSHSWLSYSVIDSKVMPTLLMLILFTHQVCFFEEKKKL